MKVFPAYASAEAWETEGTHIARRQEKLGWDLAWWLVSGRDWDRGFETSARITGYSTSHLYTLYRVGVAFPPGMNHPDLALSTHRELLRVTNDVERKLLLSRAIEEKWTQSDAVRWFETHPYNSREDSPDTFDSRNRSQNNKKLLNRKYYKSREVKCPHCGEVFPIKSNKVVSEGPGPELSPVSSIIGRRHHGEHE